MEAKHTPGPWEINKRYCSKSYIDIVSKDGLFVAEAKCYGRIRWPSRKNAEANAKLIAAAPESIICLIDSNKMLEGMLHIFGDSMSSITKFGIKKQIHENNQTIKKATE